MDFNERTAEAKKHRGRKLAHARLSETDKLKLMSPFKAWAEEQALKFIKYGDQKTLGIPRVPDQYDIDLPF